MITHNKFRVFLILMLANSCRTFPRSFSYETFCVCLRKRYPPEDISVLNKIEQNV